jgi:predicted phage-related endonuclease
MSFKEIKVNTEQEWLRLRSNVITATEMGIILGLNSYSSITKMLEEKNNPVPLDNYNIFMGNALESTVVKVANRALNKGFKLFEDSLGKTFFIDEELKLGATPDAYDEHYILECKTTSAVNFLKWFNWPPAYYLMQLYTQLICTNKDKGFLAILSKNLDQKYSDLPILIFLIQRTTKIDDMVFTELKRFWEAARSNKQFKVNRKRTQELEFRLRFSSKKIH